MKQNLSHKAGLLVAVLFTAMIFIYAGCDNPEVPGNQPVTAEFIGLSANGSEAETTTMLALLFDKDIAGLTATDITLSGNTGAVGGALTRTAFGLYELAVSGISASGQITVEVSKDGYNISPGSRDVWVSYYDPVATPVAFITLSAIPAGETTTALILTFDDYFGLEAADITFLAGDTGAVMGQLTPQGGNVYELALSGITASGQVTLAIAKSGYNINPSSQNVNIIFIDHAAFTGLTANGSETETTTKLTLTFDKDITGLSADDITLTAGTIGITKGLSFTKLAETGVYELAVTGITASGETEVRVSRDGYVISGSPQTVMIHHATLIEFTYLSANGSLRETTTGLTLTFNNPIAGLSVSDITLNSGTTGAVIGTLTGIGPEYELTVSGIIASGQVTVDAEKSGYTVSGGPMQVNVHYAVPVEFVSLSADGSATTASTTKLTLTFDKDITGLTADDIVLTAGTTGAAKGTLTKLAGTGVYELSVSSINANGQADVTLAKDGFTISPASRNTQVFFTEQISFNNLTANGSATESTSLLTLTFDKDIAVLSADDITLTAGTTGAAKGILTRTGTGVYNLAVSNIIAGGQVTVALNKNGFAFTPANRDVDVVFVDQVAFNNLTANGSETLTTTILTLTFNKDIAGLAATDITLTAGTTGAMRGDLTRTGTGVYNLAVSNIIAGGQVTVALSKSGFNFTPVNRNVNVFFADPVNFSNLTANGSATQTTTMLTLTFDKDITGLAATDITLTAGTTGAMRGALTKLAGTGVYELAVNGIVANGTVTVAVSKSGFGFTPASRNVNVFFANPVNFSNLTADGSATQTTTMLTLTFDKDITGLTATDITLTAGTTGAIRGALTKLAGTGVYELAVSNISRSGSIGVTVADKAGFNINPKTHNVSVHYAEPAAFSSLSANGSSSVTTTKLTLTFDKDITDLAATDITLTAGTTGATRGELTKLAGTGVYELAVSGIVASGTVSVSVSSPGYAITGTQTVDVFVATHGGAGITINLWENEDGQILASDNNFTISMSGSPNSFTATVNADYTDIQWMMLGAPVPGSSGTQSITINAADYGPGTNYRLSVIVYKGTMPLSTEIRFSVTN